MSTTTTSSPSKTHYTILGVSNDASPATIRKAYLKQSLQHHPDKNPSDPEGAKAKFVEIGHAYEVLSDPSQRDLYDAELRRGGGRPNGGPSSYASPGSSQTTHPSQQQSQYSYQFHSSTKSYESYRQAFDVHMANLSPAELEMLKGAATLLGSLVGSFAAKQLGGKNTLARELLETAGGLAGSVAGRSVVEVIKEESVDRLEWEEEKRRAVERGEDVPVRRRTTRRGAARGGSASDGGGGLGDWNHVVGGLFQKNENGNMDWKKTASNASNLFDAVSKATKAANAGNTGHR